MKLEWVTGLALAVAVLLTACGSGSSDDGGSRAVIADGGGNGGGGGGNGGPIGSTGNGGESVAIFDATPTNGISPRLSNNTIMLGNPGAAGAPVSTGAVAGIDGCAGETECRPPQTNGDT